MLAKGISQANIVILGLILVRMMTQSDVGTFNQAFLVYTFVSSVLAFNLDASLFYFVPIVRETRLGGFLLQSCYLTLGMGLLSAACMYFGADLIAAYFNNPRLAPFLQTLAFLPFGEKLLVLVPSFMLSHNRAGRAGFYILIGAVTKLLVVVAVLVMDGDLETIFGAIVVTVCLVGLVGTADMFRFAEGTRWQVTYEDVREQVSYCLPLMITAILGIIKAQYGKLMISRYFDAETYAIYSFGAMEIPLISLFTSSLTKAIMPDLVELAIKQRTAEMLALWQKAMRKCALLLFPCFAFLFPVAYDLMTLLFGPQYADAALPFRVYLCILPLRAGVYSALLRALGNTKPIATSALWGLISNILFSWLLIELGQGTILAFIAPSIGNVLANVVIIAVCLLAIKRLIGKGVSEILDWRAMLRILAVVVAPACLLPFIPMTGLPLAVALALKGILYAVATLGLLVVFNCLDQSELALLRRPSRLFFS